MEQSDLVLAEKAKSGDKQAFSELLAKQRTQAISWAKHIVQDTHMAEDVVQEALTNAFLKLGDVTDMKRFMPWLRTIVHNQAYMKLRRGGPYKREKPFTALASGGDADDGQPDWGNLDNVLYRASLRSSSPGEGRSDSLSDLLSELIPILGPRERAVFEKYFYEQLTPDEIAAHFDTNVNNVHKSISRIRKKLNTEKSEYDIRATLRAHFDRIGATRRLLNVPAIQRENLVHPDMSFPYAIFHALRGAGKDVTMAEVMGFTGYAFIINLLLPMIGAASAMIWDWDTFLANGLLTLGYHSRYVDYQHYKNASPSKHKADKLLFTLTMLRRSIDAGVPALLSSGLHYEVSLAYGYDDEKQLLYLTDSQSTETVPYSSLYAGRANLDTRISRELYAYVLDSERQGRSKAEQLIRLAQRIIRHAEGGDATFIPCVNGLRAYDEWIRSFERGDVDPLGNASCLTIYGWCRQQAAIFWHEQAAKAERDPDLMKWSGPLSELGDCYSRIYEVYRRLQELFPFPSGGEPDRPEHRAAAVRLLGEALQEERAALGMLKRFEAAGRHLIDREIGHIPISPFYSFGGSRPKEAEAQSTVSVFGAVFVACADLKASIAFYSLLLGMLIKAEMIDGPIGVFRLQDGRRLILIDKRLDLMHADWRPELLAVTPNMDAVFEEMTRRKWEIVYAPDYGGVEMDFFIAEDRDGHQVMVASRGFAYESASECSEGHPIQPKLHQICLAVKDPSASREAYCELFGEQALEGFVRFQNKFHLQTEDTRFTLASSYIDSTYTYLRKHSIPCHTPPVRSGDGSVSLIVTDPDGLYISIREHS